VILLLAMVSVVTAHPRGFGDNPHNMGFNPGGNFGNFGQGGMTFNQGNLKMAAQPSFGPGLGSGHGSSTITVSPSGGAFGGNSVAGNNGHSAFSGPKSTSGPGSIGSGGFSIGHSNNSSMGSGACENNTGGKTGLGGQSGFTGGYYGNGFVMTKCGSNVVIRIPFENKGKPTCGNDGAAFGCGDAFSKVFSSSDCKPGTSSVPNPIGAKGANPHHGGQHSKKGFGNPGGGNCNGHWGEGNKGKGKGNIWTGNCGRGVGEGMCGRCCHHDNDNDTDADIDTDFDTDFDTDNDMDTDFDCDMDLDLDNDTDDEVISAPAAPLWHGNDMEFSGCPALMQWLSAELGVPVDELQIYITHTLASFRDINPCDMCARLQSAALILRDSQGVRISALTEVVNEIAAPGTPISPEQMMLVAQRLAEPEPGSVYERAAEYLNTAETYVTILHDELGFSMEGSFTLAAKYIAAIDETETADYVTARLITLGR
jgi:hypothetical protein